MFEWLIVETAGATPQAILRSDALRESSVAIPAASHFRGCSSPCSPPTLTSRRGGESHNERHTLSIYLCRCYLMLCPRRCRCVPEPPKAAGGCMLSECQRCAAALRQLLWLVTWPQHARGAFCPLGEGYRPSSTLLAQSLCVFTCAPRCQCALFAVLAVASLSG